MKKLLLLLLLAVLPLFTYSQNNEKIKPEKSDGFMWGYQDLLGEWVIPPQFNKAGRFTNDGIATVGLLDKHNEKERIALVLSAHMDISEEIISIEGLIDLNGNILTQYPRNASPQQKNKKYNKALKIVDKRKKDGLYNDIYARLAQADSINQRQILQAQREQARQDSILLAQREKKRVADSIAMVKKRQADSIRLAQENRINAMPSPGQGISLKKVKVTGHGLLLSKNETWREYTIQLDDFFNRLHVNYSGGIKYSGELDVLKVIHKSDWGLLSNDLFHSVEINKMTAEISQGGRTKKFGVFSFLFTLNLEDFDTVYTDEEVNLTVSNAITQIDRYITSFIDHYIGASHFVEPLFRVKPGGREGLQISVVDKQSRGVSLEGAKDICAEARKKFAAQKINEANK